MNPDRQKELQELIRAAKADLAYCQNYIGRMQELAQIPVNAGYAQKEIEITQNTIKSHERRLSSYQHSLEQLDQDLRKEQQHQDKRKEQLRELEQLKQEIATKTPLVQAMRDNHERSIAGLSLAQRLRQRSQFSREIGKAYAELDKLTEKQEKLQRALHAGLFTGEKYQTCNRCHGSGHLQQHNHVQAGVCFKCEGTGRMPTSAFSAHMSSLGVF